VHDCVCCVCCVCVVCVCVLCVCCVCVVRLLRHIKEGAKWGHGSFYVNKHEQGERGFLEALFSLLVNEALVLSNGEARAVHRVRAAPSRLGLCAPSRAPRFCVPPCRAA
jgi:hypothetical protein